MKKLLLLISLLLATNVWGEVTEVFYDSGQLKEKGNLEDGKKEGYWEFFYENGNLKERGTYSNNKEEGIYEYFHTNGNLKSKGNAIKGGGDGYWDFFYDNGVLSQRSYWTWETDKKNGPFKGFHKNGNLAAVATYQDDSPHGPVEMFHKNGNIKFKGTYRQGKQYGFAEFFFGNGNKQSEGNYVLGKLDGLWKHYDGTEGKKILETIYNLGKVIEYPCRLEFCPSVALSKSPPVYPQRTQQIGVEGCVMTEFTVTKKGNVADERVIWSKVSSNKVDDGIFNKAALKSVKKFKYRPKEIDGVPVDVEGVLNQITFIIEDPNKDKDYSPPGCE